jgi:hypothetical protein
VRPGRSVGHSCAGERHLRNAAPGPLCASSNARAEGKLTNAAQLSHQAGKEFERIRHFLEAYLAEHSNLAAKN